MNETTALESYATFWDEPPPASESGFLFIDEYGSLPDDPYAAFDSYCNA